MQAVINLSDEGVKLRPLSCMRNAGMLEICDEPIAQRIINLLTRHGIDEIFIITGYMADNIKAYFKNGENFGVDIKYVAMGEVKENLRAHANALKESFVYISKPVYTECDISEMIRFHEKKGAYVTVLTTRGINEGMVSDKTGRVTRIEEKRMWNSILGEQGLGVYVLNRDIINFMPPDGEAGAAENILAALVRAGKSVYSKVLDGVCENTGDIASYMRASFAHLDSLKQQTKKGIVISEGAVVEKGALLEAPCYIGKNAHIHKGAKIGAYTTVGEDSCISEGASIKRSIISKNCHIGPSGTLRGCILDEGVKTGEAVTIYEQAIVGFKTKIASHVLVKSFVKIWPEKTIDKGVIVSENIMWGQKKRSKLFEDGRIKGVVNVDITPVFCTMLGSVAGGLFDYGKVGVSTDDSVSGAMLRDAIVAGLTGSGCSVKDFGEQPLPITRRGTAFYSLNGSVCINVYPAGGEDVAEITLLGKNGFDIDEKMRDKLEELFEKGDVVYPESKNIKECEYVFEYKLYYLKSIVDYKKKERLSMKALLSCPATWGRRLISSAMADFLCLVSMYQPAVDDSALQRRGFSEAVTSGGFDIGFILDSKCEKVSIVTNAGILDEDTYEALCSLIVMKKYKNAKIYVPAGATSVIDTLAERYGCDVIRTRTTPVEIMRHMAGSEKYLSDEFIFRFDAVGSVVLLMDFLTKERLDIKTLLDEIPPITMEKTIVEIPEGKMSDIMEKIQEMPSATDAAEGVKITFDKGWVIVIPDMEKEVFHVVSEGANAEFAHELCDICVNKILGK